MTDCQRPGCTNTFSPTVRAGGRGGRPRRFCTNACAAARWKAKRGGSAVLIANRSYKGERRFVATAESPDSDILGRPKTLYRFGRSPEEAEARLYDLMDEVYGALASDLGSK